MGKEIYSGPGGSIFLTVSSICRFQPSDCSDRSLMSQTIRKRKVSVMQRAQSVLLNAQFSEGTLWKTHWRTVAMLRAGWLARKQFDKGESPLSFPNTGTGKHINKVSSQITQGRLCFCKTDQLCQTILYYIWIHIFSLLKWCLLVLFNKILELIPTNNKFYIFFFYLQFGVLTV